jgi:hypothetical protein
MLQDNSLYYRPTCVIQYIFSRVQNISNKYCGDELNKIEQKHQDCYTVHTNKLRGLSPRANYTDRATADCRRS